MRVSFAAKVLAVWSQYLTSTTLANRDPGYYPQGNVTTIAGAFSGHVLNPSLPSVHSVPSASADAPLQFPSGGSQIGGTSADAPQSTLRSSLNGSFFFRGHGSLPTLSASLSRSGSSYPTPTGFVHSRGSSLLVGTGSYYPAGNASTSDVKSTPYLTEFTNRTISTSCTINAVSAQVYYWDIHRFNVTSCPRFSSKVCANQSTVAPYNLKALATRTISEYDRSPTRVPVRASLTTSTSAVSGFTNTTSTMTDIVSSDKTYTTIGHTDRSIQPRVTSTYTASYFSYTAPPASVPSDILRPDITAYGYTYGFTAVYPTSNVIYSVFEIESVKAGTGPFPTTATSKSTITAPVPFLEPYTGSFLSNRSMLSATGPINPEALGYLAYEGAGEVLGCAVGSFRGTPTVEVVPVDPERWMALVAYAHTSVHGMTPTKTTTRPRMTVAPSQVAPLIGPVIIGVQSSSAAGANARASASGSKSNHGPKGQTFSPNGQGSSQGGSDQRGVGNEDSQGGSQGGSQNGPQGNSQSGSGQSSSGQGGSGEEGAQQVSPGGFQNKPQDSNQSGSGQGDTQDSSQSTSKNGPQSNTQGDLGQSGSSQGNNSGGGSNEVGSESGGSGQSGSGQGSSSSNGNTGQSSSGQESSSQQATPGGHEAASPEGDSSDSDLGGSAGASQQIGNQGGPISNSDQGAQSDLTGGTGADGGQGSGQTPSSFKTTVGKLPISFSSHTAVINEQTFAIPPGSPAVTTSINDQSVVINPSQVIVAGQTIALPSVLAPTSIGRPSITFGGSVITANPASQSIVAGQTLSPGSAIGVGGTKLSLGSHAASIVIGTRTIPLKQQPNITPAPGSPSFVFDGNTFTVNPTSPLTIGGQTLSPGGRAITVSGTRLSLAPSASQIVIGEVTLPLNTKPAPITEAPALTIGGQKFTPNPAGQYIVGGQTLIPGGPAITVSGTRISLAPSVSQLVLGSSTIPLSGYPLPTLTIGGQTITPNPSGQYIIDGQTLSPGGSAITVSGTRISLGASASDLVVGSSTLPLSAGAGEVTAYPTLTVGHQTVTANAQGQYVIGGQTLTAGGMIAVSGTPISLAPGESDVVIGTSIEGLGGAIMGGFGPGPTATAGAASSLVAFEGAARKASLVREWWMFAAGTLVWIFA